MANNIDISAIFLGNMPDIDTKENNYKIEDKANLLGTYGSAADPLKNGVVTIVSNSPTDDLDVDHHGTGLGILTYDLGVGSVTTSLDSVVLYNTTVIFMDGSTTTLELDVIQTTNGDVFALPWDGFAILGSKGIKSFTPQSVYDDDYAGIYQSDFDNVQFVCFAEGTLIMTLAGERRVERLTPGDLVVTLDHGPQVIRWTRSSTHPLDETDIDAKPVQIKAGALGRNLPTYDLVVSPQHRILVGGAGAFHQIFADEVFAPAKSLTLLPGVRHMQGKKQTTWIHFACDRHEIIIANGCLSESLLLGPMVLKGLSYVERRVLMKIFGNPATSDAALNGPPARECLTVGAVRRQLGKQHSEKVSVPDI